MNIKLNRDHEGYQDLCVAYVGIYLSSHTVTRIVLSAKVCLTSVFGMGTGGPTPQSTPTRRNKLCIPRLGLKAQGSVTPLFLLSKS